MDEQRLEDDSRRRAFKPPRQRAPRRRIKAPQVNLWQYRHGFGLGLVRAACAIGFGFVPAASSRFGDAALVLVAVALAVMVVAVVTLLQRMNRPLEWPLLADAATLFVLVPVLVTASAIEVADARFGGRGENFLAAASAVVLLYLIVATIATRGWSVRGASGQIGALPGPLSITIILLGTANFSAGGIWRGLSIAWMAAALITAVAVFVPVRYRPIVAPSALSLFAIFVVLQDASSGSGSPIGSGASAIAAIATACVAGVLILIPGIRTQQPQYIPPPE